MEEAELDEPPPCPAAVVTRAVKVALGLTPMEQLYFQVAIAEAIKYTCRNGCDGTATEGCSREVLENVKAITMNTSGRRKVFDRLAAEAMDEYWTPRAS